MTSRARKFEYIIKLFRTLLQVPGATALNIPYADTVPALKSGVIDWCHYGNFNRQYVEMV